jgi:addiction module RelB/DinJ family antitoxin
MTMDQINVRIDAMTKTQAEAVLSKIGLAPSDAIRMLYRQLIMRQALPFMPRVSVPAAKRVEKNTDKIRKAIKKSLAKNEEALSDLAKR